MRLPSDADISGRDFGAEELALLNEVIQSGTLNCTKGSQVKQLEKDFAELHGVPYCRAITSGTAALHCAVAAIDPEPGDEIITTSITDMGAIVAILFQAAIPVFCDVDPITLNVTAECVKAKVTSRTKAIVVTHLFGLPVDVDAVREACPGIPIIEDCAQAYLATVNGKLVGTIGDIGCFSMQQGKHMTTGEGGFAITSDPHYAKRIVLFSDKGWAYGDPNPDHMFLAPNYRMTELQGAVARAQLGKVQGCVERRQAAASMLTEKLIDVPGLTLPVPPPGSSHVYWKYALIVDPNVIPGGAVALGAQLKAAGIFCAPRYIVKPAFECKVIAEKVTFGTSGFPFSLRPEIVNNRADFDGTYQGLDRVLVLPWNEFYTQEHVDFLATQINLAVEKLTTAQLAQ
jgi:perosamine synthetase